jgi:hypothetical protein
MQTLSATSTAKATRKAPARGPGSRRTRPDAVGRPLKDPLRVPSIKNLLTATGDGFARTFEDARDYAIIRMLTPSATSPRGNAVN